MQSLVKDHCWEEDNLQGEYIVKQFITRIEGESDESLDEENTSSDTDCSIIKRQCIIMGSR